MSPALRVEEIDHNGYILEDLGLAKIISHYHKFYFYFNISIIENNYKILIANVHILETKNNISHPLLHALRENCIEIENELLKFNYIII